MAVCQLTNLTTTEKTPMRIDRWLAMASFSALAIQLSVGCA